MPDVKLETFKTITEESKDIITQIATGMIVVYKDTKDNGQGYVARLWKFKKRNHKRFGSAHMYIATKYVVTGNTLEEIKNKIPFFLYWIARDENDDPCIIGSYV